MPTPSRVEETDIHLFCTGKQPDTPPNWIPPSIIDGTIKGLNKEYIELYSTEKFFETRTNEFDNLKEKGTPLLIPVNMSSEHWVLYSVFHDDNKYRIECTNNVSAAAPSPKTEHDIKNQLLQSPDAEETQASYDIPIINTPFLTGHNRGGAYCGYVVCMSALMHRLDYTPDEKSVVADQLSLLYKEAQGDTDDGFYQCWRKLRENMAEKTAAGIKTELENYLKEQAHNRELKKGSGCMSWCGLLQRRTTPSALQR